MSDATERYTEVRGGGTETVGTYSACRVPDDLREWIRVEAFNRNDTQRSVIEDSLKTFLAHRKSRLKAGDPIQYEALHKRGARILRVMLRIDLIEELNNAAKEDDVSNGNLVVAALRLAQGV